MIRNSGALARGALALGLLGLPPTHAAAQEAFLLDELVASAQMSPVPVNRTGATVETLDAGEIAQGTLDLGRTLESLPGVSSTASGGLGAPGALRLRGLDSKYIGVRVDGMDVTDPSGTQNRFEFGVLTRGMAERIEVLKGSQSALYGSEAIAGVLDITSWRPSEAGFSGRLSAEAGSFGTTAATTSLGHKGARGALALTLSRVEAEGFSARAGDTEKDGFTQNLAVASLRYDLTEAVSVGLNALASDSEAAFDRSAFDNSGTNQETRTGLRAFATYAQGAASHELSIARVETDRFDEGGFTKAFLGTRTSAEYQGSLALREGLTLGYGLDWTEEKARLDGVSYAAEGSAVFAEAQIALSPALDLALSGRYDVPEAYDNQLSGRAALAWRLPDGLIVRAVLGTGFRAPSLYERFGPYTNPDLALNPEKSRSAELGLEKRYGDQSFARVTLFRTEIDELIDYDFAESSYAQIPGTTRSQGVELSGQVALGRGFSLVGNYTYTEARTEEDRLLRVPRHDLSLGLAGALSDRVSGQIGLQAVADRTDINAWPEPPSALEDYTVLNTRLGYAITPRTEAWLRIDNLLDESYEELRGFNTGGRSLHVGLSARF